MIEYTDRVWKLREYYKLVKKVKENMHYSNNSKKYFISKPDRMLEALNR